MKINHIYSGSSLDILKTLPTESVDMCITSPPYWGLRDYVSDGQLGLEPTLQEYINKLCYIFDEVKRVLKPEGTCWVNLGDTYGGANSRASFGGRARFGTKREGTYQKGQDKSLCQVPSHFAIEMTNRGWILRNEIIWHKPNCMPTSVKDRFTVDFEKLFFFTKSKKYWFEKQFEPLTESSDVYYRKMLRKNKQYNTKKPYLKNTPYCSKHNQANLVSQTDPHRQEFDIKSMNHTLQKGRNKRCVWRIPTKPYKGAHFAAYPPDLIETPIKAGCPDGGIVLDPFMGSGTTGVVSKQQNKNYIGIELNEEYINIA
ncbi:MAG TPA: site-specific DNA-methyltransferase, partial [bacterium]|nr:site-specific DNA-methyltransferase [bacterium]